MFSFLKSKKTTLSDQKTGSPASPEENREDKEDKPGLMRSLREKLTRTRHHLGEGLATLFLGKKEIDADLLADIETQLLLADVGVEACQEITETLSANIKRQALADPEALYQQLKQILTDMLTPCSETLTFDSEQTPYVILMVGVNGSGKTTTIGKLAKNLQQAGRSVMLAAGDTFRAAAVEQLQAWGTRNQIQVIAQKTGADSASVIFDALQAAKAKKIDVLIADTAGRLHTQTHLMEELKKIKRVMSKLDAKAPHEVMLVLDAGIGQNALRQVEQFQQAVQVSGLVLTKLDGTAKGGIIFAIAKKTKLPIRFIGVGEGIDDLRPFDANQFTDALFSHDPIS